jgi:hypothetical protein
VFGTWSRENAFAKKIRLPQRVALAWRAILVTFTLNKSYLPYVYDKPPFQYLHTRKATLPVKKLGGHAFPWILGIIGSKFGHAEQFGSAFPKPSKMSFLCFWRVRIFRLTKMPHPRVYRQRLFCENRGVPTNSCGSFFFLFSKNKRAGTSSFVYYLYFFAFILFQSTDTQLLQVCSRFE